LLLLVAGAVFCVLVHALILDAFDESLEARAAALASLTSREGRIIEIDFDLDYMPAYAGPETAEEEAAGPEDDVAAEEDDDDDVDPAYFQMFLEDGRVVRRSPSLGAADLPLGAMQEGAAFRNLRLPDDSRGRLVQIAFLPRFDLEPEEDDDVDADEDPLNLFPLPAGVDEATARVVLVVAGSRGHLDLLLATLYGSYALVTLGALGAIGLWVRVAVARGLVPFAALNAQLRTIGPETLDGRVNLDAPPREFDAILGTLNNLLDRVEAGYLRERRFSSDVAHELRTPVAELRAACEIGGRWPDDPEAARGFFHDAEDIALQMERIVQNLLALTRCDNGTETVERRAFALEPLVRACWSHAAATAERKGLRFAYHVDPELIVDTDHDKLTMIVQNLVDNAVAYAVPDTEVICRGSKGADGVDLCFENNASNLMPGDLEFVFERFWRKDRTLADGSRSGLGLSIVKALAELLGIPVHVRLGPKDTFEVRMRVPT
jgi:signal transduction histidine kinase